MEHIIDLDTDPFVGGDFVLESHRRMGQFKWDPTKVRLYLTVDQEHHRPTPGAKLLEEMSRLPVFNANLLRYLKQYPELIPTEWQKLTNHEPTVLAWGTIFKAMEGSRLDLPGRYVAGLTWYAGHWMAIMAHIDTETDWLNEEPVPALLLQE